MTLRQFHLVFIGFSVVLSAFFGVWLLSMYRDGQGTGYLIFAAGAVACGVGLAAYGAAFQRKCRRLGLV